LGRSSTRVVPPLAASISTSPWTVTGSRAAFAVVGAAVFAIFGRFCRLGEGVFGADAVVTEEALEDCGAVVCDSEVMTPAEDMPDVGISDDVVDSKVECVAPLSPHGRGDVLNTPEVALALFRGKAPSWLLASSASCAEPLPTALTASLNRVYKPLSPCCTRSPAVALFSEEGSEPGGGAKSLKVVRTPDWLADV